MPRLTPTARRAGGRAGARAGLRAGARAGLRGARRGFSLPELIITLFLLSIVGTAIVRVFTKQQQSYKDTAKTATMRRELRMSGMLMTQDVRSISSSGGDVLEMSEKRAGFNGTYGSSIVCAKGANTLYIPPPGLVHHELTSWTSFPKVGDTIYVYNDSLLAGAEDDVWQKLAIADIDKNLAACPGAPFTDPVLDAPAVKPRYKITVSYPSPSTQIGDSVKVGAVIRFTRPMRYELFQPSGSGKWYLCFSEYSGRAWTAAEPVAGPFRPFVAGDGTPSGLQFRYYDSLGTRLTSITDKPRLSRVDVYTRAEGGASAVTERKGALMTDSTLFRIGLRNFK